MSGFDTLYGLEVIECSDGLARGRVRVRDELLATGGFVHGGVYGAIAESLSRRGTVVPEGQLAVGLANQTTVLHPIAQGTIHATATRRHRGRTTWVWEVEMADDRGRRCAMARVTIAVLAR